MFSEFQIIMIIIREYPSGPLTHPEMYSYLCLSVYLDAVHIAFAKHGRSAHSPLGQGPLQTFLLHSSTMTLYPPGIMK